MAFTEKLINVQFNMANGQFEGGGNTYTARGLRCQVHIENTAGTSNSQAEISIYGLPLSVMNQLSTVGTQAYKMYKNSITVEAGDANGMTLVFGGAITNAFVDAQGMPNVAFRVQASPGAFVAIQPAKPLSINGAADVAGMMGNLAKQMGFAFENVGVNVKLSNPYFGGTAWWQAIALAKHAGIDMIVERNTLVIIPPGQTRSGDAVLVSPQTGLVNYPAFNQANVLVRVLFNPEIKYGGAIQVQSSLTPANGKWKVSRLSYDLESNEPNGKWFMDIEGVQIGPTVS